MSGGYFDYKQYNINDIVLQIDELIEQNYYADNPHPYSPDTIDKFKRAVKVLMQGMAMVQRIDWLVSGDDSEESFHKRWQKELSKIG